MAGADWEEKRQKWEKNLNRENADIPEKNSNFR
jgi:hypothetical protein